MVITLRSLYEAWPPAVAYGKVIGNPTCLFLFCEGGYISLNFTSSSLDTLLNLIGVVITLRSLYEAWPPAVAYGKVIGNPTCLFLFCEGGYISLNFTSSSLDTLLNLIG